MDEKRIGEIEGLLAGITPGRWTYERQDSLIIRIDHGKGIAQVRMDNGMPLVFQWDWLTAQQAEANAALIAACGGDESIVRELLAEVKNLELQLSRYEPLALYTMAEVSAGRTEAKPGEHVAEIALRELKGLQKEVAGWETLWSGRDEREGRV